MLQEHISLTWLGSAASCLCCVSADLQNFGDSASVPAADSNCTGLVQAGLTEEDGEALWVLICLWSLRGARAPGQASFNVGVAPVSPCINKFMLRDRKCLHAGRSEAFE